MSLFSGFFFFLKKILSKMSIGQTCNKRLCLLKVEKFLKEKKKIKWEKKSCLRKALYSLIFM